MTTGIRGDHLARLQNELKRSSDRIYELERRLGIKPTALRPARPFDLIDAKGDLIAGIDDNRVTRLGVGSNYKLLRADSTATGGLAWDDPAPEWTGSALPTTNLWFGRRVYATGLTNTNFGPNNGKRLYQYGEAPIGQTGPAWRLVTPIVYTVAFTGSSASGSPHNAVSSGFGAAPCPVDAVVSIHGRRSSTTVVSEARITRTTTGSTTPLTTPKAFFAPQVSGELSMVGAFAESRPTGADVAYGVQFASSGTVTWSDWHITITLT